MIVTDLKELSKSRSKVYLDDEFAFVLYKGELRLFQIKIGQVLSDEAYTEITEVILVKRAKLRCMNLLKAREYTEFQLRSKLKEGWYPDEIIDTAIAYVKSYHYVDDREYARRYVEYKLASRSKKRLEMDLYKKGIASEIIKEVFEQLVEGEVENNEEIMIQKLLLKKKYDCEMTDSKEKVKIQQFLLRKGYSYEMINKAMRCFYITK